MRSAAWVLTAVLLVWVSNVFALTEGEEKEIRDEANNFQYHTVTQEGLAFRVPEDMAVEKRNGILAPVPFDEYMYSKFKKIDEKLKAIDKKLDDIETLLKAPKK